MFIREGEGKFLGALGFPPISGTGSARATLLRGNLLINSQLVSAARRLINGRPPLARWRHAYSRARATSLHPARFPRVCAPDLSSSACAPVTRAISKIAIYFVLYGSDDLPECRAHRCCLVGLEKCPLFSQDRRVKCTLA